MIKGWILGQATRLLRTYKSEIQERGFHVNTNHIRLEGFQIS